MTNQIEVETVSEGTFHVRVIEGKRETSHTVTLRPPITSESPAKKSSPPNW